MRYGFVIAMTALAVTASPAALADERADAELSWERPWTAGDFLRVENLIGSITVDGASEPGIVRVRARVVAEGDDEPTARALADSIRLDVAEGEAGPVVRTAFPVDAHAGFRPPRAEDGGFLGRVTSWVTPLVRKRTVAVDWDGRPVQVGDVKGGAAVAVHLHVSLPLDSVAEFRQVLGTLDVARLRGATTLDLVEGRAEAVQMYGTLLVRTGGGAAAVKSFKGERLEVETVSGDIEVVDLNADAVTLSSTTGWVRGSSVSAGSLDVATARGDVEMDAVEPRALAVRADQGAVDFGTRLKRTREASIVAGGDVTLRVGEVTPFDLVATTRKGRISSKGIDLREIDGTDGAARWRRGAGGVDVVVTTTGGSLTVRGIR